MREIDPMPAHRVFGEARSEAGGARVGQPGRVENNRPVTPAKKDIDPWRSCVRWSTYWNL
jgi:hypothetical protein